MQYREQSLQINMDLFDNPSLMTVSEGEPRIIDTIFNVTGLVNNLFNTSNNALFTYVGGLVLFIVLVGKKIGTISLKFFYFLHFRTCFICSRCLLQSDF